MKFLVFVCLLSLLSACGGGSSCSDCSAYNPNTNNDNSNSNGSYVVSAPSYVDPRMLQEPYDWAGRGEINQLFSSSITGVTYDYHVYLPPEYDLEPERHFAVLYVTDAQYDATFHAKVLDFEQRPVIMVAISEGPTGRRATDYIMPGARVYFDFFTREFIPHVENQYRILAENRTFLGASAGGQIALVTLFLDRDETPIFKNHISLDPWIPNNVLENLIDDSATIQRPFNKTLFISSATDGGFTRTVHPFVGRLRARNLNGLSIHERIYAVTHFDVTWASLSHAFAIIYSDQ
jgi:hypothetical protein